jgi:predicted DNA binding protein
MRDIDIQASFNSTKRKVVFEVQDESFEDDIDRKTEEFERLDRKRNRLRKRKRNRSFEIALSASEANEITVDFVNFHGMVAMNTTRVRKREKSLCFLVKVSLKQRLQSLQKNIWFLNLS